MDPELLRTTLEQSADLTGLVSRLELSHPHLFSHTVVFVPREAALAMQAVVGAIERVIALPQYQAQALTRVGDTARRDFGPRGVFTSYDFHLSASGPRLIEINTNAGGGLLSAVLARAQRRCCAVMDEGQDSGPRYELTEDDIVAMFRSEWRLQRGGQVLSRILLVDEDPATQHLAPEFELFRRLFERHGITASIADAAELCWESDVLTHHGAAVDLIYNRLTDFQLTAPAHQALRQAYLAGAVVLTPHPRAHALYADKRNLVVLSDAAQLTRWGISSSDRQVLEATIPKTELLDVASAERLWSERDKYFFKPFAGYGARATYRGDKITRRVWDEIKCGGFIAQALVPPAERLVEVDGATKLLKFDVRAYTYAGRLQLISARLYRGQTTNMRTPGGGFAPVIVAQD